MSPPETVAYIPAKFECQSFVWLEMKVFTSVIIYGNVIKKLIKTETLDQTRLRPDSDHHKLNAFLAPI